MESSNSNKTGYGKIYLKTKINMILLAVVFIGAINWGATALGYNLVQMLSTRVNSYFNVNYPIDKVIYISVALCAIWLASKKTTWLPFLGYGIMPGSVVPLSKPTGANKKINIKTKPNAKIVYWASKNSDEKDDVVDAYGNYSNAGVVMADAEGNAVAEIIEGAGYVVPTGKSIPRHIHFRIIGSPDGMMGKVMTAKY